MINMIIDTILWKLESGICNCETILTLAKERISVVRAKERKGIWAITDLK
jgi:hypothetical protein